jgi:hypothetical protein
MIEIAPNLWVGSDEEHKAKAFDLSHGDQALQFSIVHACKEPYHRKAVGYAPGKAAPQGEHYLLKHAVERHGCIDVPALNLNLIDANNPQFVPVELVNRAVVFIRGQLQAHYPVLVHCNKGQSRAPTIALLALADVLERDFDMAEEWMRDGYPNYAPAAGMRGFAEAHWDVYRGRVASGHMVEAAS